MRIIILDATEQYVGSVFSKYSLMNIIIFFFILYVSISKKHALISNEIKNTHS